MPAGALKAALDSSFLVARRRAEIQCGQPTPELSTVPFASPFDVSDADPVQDFSAWLQRLGGAVKQTILDWVHFPLPSGLDKVFGHNHAGAEDEGEAARLGAGPHPPGMSGPFPPRPSGIHAWHPTARNALYSEVNNPNQPEPPPNWPRGVTWPARAVVDRNGKWWPPPGWANGVGAENGCGPARWIYSCGWRNRDDWGKDATSVWYDAAHQLAEAGNNPRRLLAKEAREDAAYLDRLRGFRSGRQGPPEPPRAAQVVEIDDGPVPRLPRFGFNFGMLPPAQHATQLSSTAAKQFSMVEIVEQEAGRVKDLLLAGEVKRTICYVRPCQGGSAAATAEEQATDTILDLQKSNADAKPRRRPLPLSDEEESEESEGEPAAVAYAAASGLPARQELDRGAASLPASLSNKVLQLQAMASNSSEVLYESQSQEASPQAGLPSLRRGRHAFPDEAEHMPLGRSPPLSPSGEAPRSEVEVPHDALHVGPLDFASSFGGVDPAVVYVRLSNFAARRRGSLRLQAAPEEADDGLEPFSPVIHAGTEPPTFMTDSRQKRRRSRSGSDYSQCSSPYGSSPNLQAVAEVSCEDLPGHKAIEESLPRHDSDDGRPADHLEHHSLDRCCTWNDYRRTSEGPAEEEEIASIQRHLEAMNAAAADLNAAQESLAACMRRQRTMVQLWAVVSARLARAVGSKQLAKATPHYVCQKRCKEAQNILEEAASRMMTSSKDEVDALTSQYAAGLRDFQAARAELEKLSSEAHAPTPAALAAVRPYFEAEDEHREQLAEEELQEEKLRQNVAQAKLRYHSELRSLEALSNQAHLRRASSGYVDAVSRTASGAENPAMERTASQSSARRTPVQTPEQRPAATFGRSLRKSPLESQRHHKDPSAGTTKQLEGSASQQPKKDVLEELPMTPMQQMDHQNHGTESSR
ncbi:Sh3bp5l [Symbiodinium sp. CCMP2592]|nr:Sh3bp5l [Symbiodinium sp. CCMP2592]